MKKIMKKNQVIITSLAILIAVAGYLNFADVDLGFKDKEASTDSSSILEEVEYDLTDETALLDENGQMAREIFQLQELPEKPYLQELLILQPRQSFPESRCALRTRQSFRRSLEISISVRRKSRKPSIPWYP